MTLSKGLGQTTIQIDNVERLPVLDYRGLPHKPVHGVMVHWDPPKPAGGRQVPDPTMTEHGICPRASICYIYSGIK